MDKDGENGQDRGPEREAGRGAGRGAEARPRRMQPAAAPERPAAPAAAKASDGREDASRKPAGPPKPAGARKPRPRPPAPQFPSAEARRTAPAAGDPRAAALALLAGLREGIGIDDQIAAGVLDRLTPPERARAQRLGLAALRLRGRAEAVLDPLLERRPKPLIADLLLLAVTEMLHFNAAPHGVVSAAVALARKQGQKGAAAAGMVNAVLRRAAEGAQVWADARPATLPDWLRAPLVAQWGEDATRAIEAAHERGAALDLTPKAGVTMPGAEALPTGSLRLAAGTQVSALPGFAAGDWWVQDAAAALPVRLLDPRAGEAIADLCAAPGGKTLQLAASGARVTAVDIAPARLERLRQNLARGGLDAQVVTGDALTWVPDAPLDAALLDAPCSATGTIRRHPELPMLRDGSGLAALTALQAALIDHALTLLPPGGRLVYATCSLLEAEGEAQATAALARHPGLTVEALDAAALGIDPGWITREGGLRLRPDLWPERGGMDGFYMVRLRKPAA